MLFWPILGDFWCPVVTLVTFSSNLKKNQQQKNPPPKKLKQKKTLKNPKKTKNLPDRMSVRNQFGHGLTRLSVRAHFGYGQTQEKISKNTFFQQLKNIYI